MDHLSARELVMTYGWNTTAYQILNPGLHHWYASHELAVVAYTRRQNVLLVAGAPVCDAAALVAVMAEFEQHARLQGCRVCYVCAAERMRVAVAGRAEYSTIVIGAQPVWNPQRWARVIESRRSLRAQLARARNKGVMVEAIPCALGRDDPELDRVLDEWLRSRGLPPLHFLVEPRTFDGAVADRVLLVARRAGTAVAFLVASPVVARNGFLIEQVARSPRAPNGVSELLIDAAMRRFAEDGREYVTLGLVALSNQVGGANEINPWWLRLMMTFARAHANRFYNFRGLERFRLKMLPAHWETIYAISNESRFSLRTLYALGEAFSGISPWRALGLGVLRALSHELRRLRLKPVRSGGLQALAESEAGVVSSTKIDRNELRARRAIGNDARPARCANGGTHGGGTIQGASALGRLARDGAARPLGKAYRQ
jgi:phosphatidylglycerol lysyltransferase